MPEREVGQLLESLKGAHHKVNPDPAWVASTRNRLLQHIALTTEEVPQRIFTLNHLWSALSLIIPQRTVYKIIRPAVIFLGCFSIGTAGWITTVSASLNSLPGDTLYPVKIATEATQVAVVEAMQGKTASTELRLSFASRRAEEVNKIIESTNSQEDKQARVQKAVEQLKSDVQGVNESLAAAQQDSPESGAAVAKIIDRKVTEIQISLATSAAITNASSTQAVVAIAQLQQETDRLKQGAASSTAATTTTVIITQTPAATSTPTSTTAVSTTTSSVQIDFVLVVPTSTPATTTTSSPVVQQRPVQPRVVAPPKEKVVEPVPVVNDAFPERPKELDPNVVDNSTPITLEGVTDITAAPDTTPPAQQTQ